MNKIERCYEDTITHVNTKQQMVEALGLNFVYDYALPQTWVDEAKERGFDVRPHFVWRYPENIPYPITHDGLLMLCKIGAHI